MKVLAPLRVADYRKLWIAQLVSVVGDKLNMIAMGIMVYQLTGSMLHMGAMLATATVPAALFGLVAGAYVDRWDRRTTMITADVVRAVLVLLIPVSVAKSGIVSAYVIAFLVGTVSLFFEPAKLSLVPELVPDEELLAANSLDNASMSVAELGGLAAAGAVVAVLGYARAFAIDGLSYAISAVLILCISHRPVADGRADASEPPATGTRRRGVIAGVIEGATYVRSMPLLRDVIGLTAFAAVGLAATTTLAYALAFDWFDAGAPGLALLDGAISVGLLVGTLLVGRSDPARSGAKLLAGLLCLAIVFGLAAAAPTIWVAAAVFFVGGIANMWFLVPAITILQRSSQQALRGRVMAVRQTVSRVMATVGLLVAGALVDPLGVRTVFLVAAAIVGAASLWGWSRNTVRTA